MIDTAFEGFILDNIERQLCSVDLVDDLGAIVELFSFSFLVYGNLLGSLATQGNQLVDVIHK